MDVIKVQGKNRKNGIGDNALNYIKKLYKLEKDARKKGFTTEQIYRMRQYEAKLILNDSEKWLFKKKLQTPLKGLLSKTISYIMNQWTARYCTT